MRSTPELATSANTTLHRQPSQALRRLLRRVLMGQGLLLLVVGWLITSANVPFTKVRVERSAIVPLGAVLLVVGASRRTSPQLNVLLAAILGVAIGGFAVGYRAPMKGDMAFGITHTKARVMTSDSSWIEIGMYPTGKSGLTLQASESVREFCQEFDVTYRTDADGCRKMPVPTSAGPHDEIWFSGCSFTFGAGVEDEETYPYLLASQAWPAFRVRNYAIGGSGTTNAYISLREKLARGPSPRVVIYGWIRNHLRRNYLRKSWFAHNDSLIPKFELTDGRLRDFGLVPSSEATLEDCPELDETEFHLTVALIREMARMCRARDIPFVMLVLNDKDNHVPLAVLDEPGLDVLDVHEVSKAYYPQDGHPQPSWHSAVASAIAAHPLLANLTHDPRLLVPAAFPQRSTPMSEKWQLWAGEKEDLAKTEIPSQDRLALRLKMLSGSAKSAVWKVQLKLPVNLKKDREYLLEVEMRSDSPRSLDCGVLQNHAPYKHLAPREAVQLTPEWRTFQKKFTVNEDDPESQIVMAVGSSEVPLEIRKAVFLEDGKEIDTRHALHLQSTGKRSDQTGLP